jgi:plasmid maintenance system antidote protein VapI
VLVNLKRCLDAKGISYRAYGAILGISEKSAWNKVNGKTDITLPEAMTTKAELFPEYDFDYLFASDRGA